VAFRALKCHVSQAITRRVDRIINSDEIFRKRRTDSLSYTSEISSTSGDPSKLNDFMLENCIDIDSDIPVFGNYLWMPDGNDPQKTAYFKWDTTVSVSEVVLYGNIAEDGRILNAIISFDDGYSIESGPIPKKGRPLILRFPQRMINSCSISIVESEGEGAGISEIEIYSESENCRMPAPFIKVCVGDDFAYEYLIDGKTEEFGLEIYSYGKVSNIDLQIVSGEGRLRAAEPERHRYSIFIPRSTDVMVLEAVGEAAEKKVFDRLTVRRISTLKAIMRRTVLALGKIRIIKEKIVGRMSKALHG
jgi:hypothetical protein